MKLRYSLKSKRINKQSQFSCIFKRCIKKETTLFKGYCANTQSQNKPGVALIINKKFGNAVKRNKYRRIVREIIRKNQYSLAEDKDVILIFKKTNREWSYNDIQTALISLFTELTLWKKNKTLSLK